MIPKTAGRFVTEAELRTYIKCSELHNFGGEVTSDIKLQMVEQTIEHLTSISLRRKIEDPLFLINKTLLQAASNLGVASTLMEQQVQTTINKCVIWTNDFFEIFRFSQYVPIYGPFEWTVQVSKTPVKLRVSGLYRSRKNQTLHAVCFSPYLNTHALENDPTTHLKIATLSQAVKPHSSGRAQCKIHLFSITPSGNLVYTSVDSNETNTNFLNMVKTIIKNMEAGYHYPLVPCPYGCPFKHQCKPEVHYG